MKNFKTINSINFEQLTGKKLDKALRTFDYYFYKANTLYDCYVNPSQSKNQIFRYWSNNLDKCFIAGYNCMSFSIVGIINNHKVYITKSHNYILD